MAEAHGMVFRTVGFVGVLVRRDRRSGDRHLTSHPAGRSRGSCLSLWDDAATPFRVDEGRSLPGRDRG